MNKNVKKIISLTIILTAFSTWVSSTIHIGEQRAYAYIYSDNELSNIKVASGTYTIPVYSSISYKNDYRIKSFEEIPVVLYSKISSNQTNVNLDTLETKAADTRVFVGKEKLKLTDIHSAINIAQGEKKSIYIRLYDSKNAADDSYATEYQLIVEREVSDGEDSEDNAITLKNYDDIYLTRLELYNNDKLIDINFNQTQPVYNLNVDDSLSYIRIKAVPEQESYKLIINDKDIDTKGSNKDVRDILLNSGTNVVKIRIISSDHKYREYFLNITKGKSTTGANSNNSTPSTNTSSQNTQNTQNVQPAQTQVTAGWQYRNANGTLAVGWTFIGSQWYYFDSTGAMKTGWVQDSSGKWYYLTASGVMAKNTVISGYKIGPDGAWIKK